MRSFVAARAPHGRAVADLRHRGPHCAGGQAQRARIPAQDATSGVFVCTQRATRLGGEGPPMRGPRRPRWALTAHRPTRLGPGYKAPPAAGPARARTGRQARPKFWGGRVLLGSF